MREFVSACSAAVRSRSQLCATSLTRLSIAGVDRTHIAGFVNPDGFVVVILFVERRRIRLPTDNWRKANITECRVPVTRLQRIAWYGRMQYFDVL